MSLPWFAFHIDKFLSDTLGLDGPAIGAYTLLILHYYATEKPPRDNDRVLATIARLPFDVWMERRPELEEFFQIRDGAWHHATIEAEMAEAKLKHSAGIARASAGGLARWGKGAPKPASSKARVVPQASSELAATMKNARSNAPALPVAELEQSPSNAHLHKQESLSVSVLTVEKDNSGDNSVDAAFPQNDGSFPQNSDEPEESLGTPIDPQFWPCENHITVCNIDGADDETIKREVGGFIATHQERGTFSHDWDASWTMWWKRWKDHRDQQAAKAAKTAKPRVEVSSRFQPTDDQWSTECVRFAQNASLWSRQFGPEPGQTRCRCPHRIMLMAGIDPATGLKISAALIDMKLAALEPEKV